MLTLELVDTIHEHGGTLLGSSRGPQDVGDMVDTLVKWNVGVLFAIGGDGTLRGASALHQEITRRGLRIGVIGVPKTIDNDLEWIERSFGFATAVEAADNALWRPMPRRGAPGTASVWSSSWGAILVLSRPIPVWPIVT
jgi:6-phosphofructokinase 1